MDYHYESEHFFVDEEMRLQAQTADARVALRRWIDKTDPEYWEWTGNDPAGEQISYSFYDSPFALVSAVDDLEEQIRAANSGQARFNIEVTVDSHGSATVSAAPLDLIPVEAHGDCLRDALEGLLDTLETVGYVSREQA